VKPPCAIENERQAVFSRLRRRRQQAQAALNPRSERDKPARDLCVGLTLYLYHTVAYTGPIGVL